MSKTLIIVGGAIATVLAVGVGGYAMTDAWLDDKAETEIEAQLLEATGGLAEVGSADVQLLRQRVAVNDIKFDGVDGFESENLLNIDQLTLDKPDLQAEEVTIEKAQIEGITINLNADTMQLQEAFMSLGHSDLNIEDLANQIPDSEDISSGSNSAEGEVSGFEIGELQIGAIAVNIDLEVPWQTERLQHSLEIPAATLTDVTEENIAEKLMVALGEPAFQEFQAFAFQEILPASLGGLSESLPAEIDLSDITLPEGVELELPESIELPEIKLPQGN